MQVLYGYGARVCLLEGRKEGKLWFDMQSLSMWRLCSRVYSHNGCSSLFMASLYEETTLGIHMPSTRVHHSFLWMIPLLL